MKISALNRKLRKAFGGRVTAVLADGCIVLRGALDRWDDVVRAGQMAATKYSTCHVVNDITFTGGEDAPMRVPTLRDDALDGQTPDVLIIGGGISGVSIARELTRQKLDILVVDKECDLALGASGRNDGEVHPGIDLGRGSVKHKYIRRGNAMYDQICKELDVPFSRVGQYVCFQHGWLRPAVWGYCMWRKYHDGIADTELISGRELLRREPNFNEKTRFAISNPGLRLRLPLRADDRLRGKRRAKRRAHRAQHRRAGHGRRGWPHHRRAHQPRHAAPRARHQRGRRVCRGRGAHGR